MIDFLSKEKDTLCENCQTRLEKNPLRVLDCKIDGARFAGRVPTMQLCPECQAHFNEVQALLKGKIDFVVDPMLVRGLDYYTKTVFEIIANSEGYSGTVCGGGRYDGLLEQLGGPKLPGIGFGMGMERLLLIAELSGAQIPQPRNVEVYVAAMGEEARKVGFTLTAKLRGSGIKTEFDHVGKSFKAQFKYANKIGARFVAILGDEELERGEVKLKDMETGDEGYVPIAALGNRVQQILR